jgi:hypothetical protein
MVQPMACPVCSFFLSDLQNGVWMEGQRDYVGRFFQFPNLYTVGRSPWTSDQPVARPLPTHRTTQTQNKRTQTSMHRMGSESSILAFERANTVHALDRAAIVIVRKLLLLII